MNNKKLILLTAFCLFALPQITVSQNTQRTIRMYGIAVPKDSVVMRSSLDGHIQKMNCVEGQFVKKGEVLIELECETSRARLYIAKLEADSTGFLENAAADLEFAQSNFLRISSLLQKNASHIREFNQAKLRLRNSEAALKIQSERAAANQARYDLAKAELEQYFLRAPFDGVVVQVQTGLGESVSDQNELLRIVSLDAYRVELYLPVKQANELKIGQMVRAQINKPFQKDVEAQVVFRSPLIEAATGTTRVVVEIDNRKLNLPAGFTVTLENDITKRQNVSFSK